MVTKTLSDGLERYTFWKSHVSNTINEIQNWLVEHDLNTEKTLDIYTRCTDKLESDNITIAFVGEFSRGKTELINSLFFSDYGRRLLPSDAGRTTMCPTEIFYDNERDEAYLRLLPIETRLRNESLSELIDKPEEWTELPLHLDNPEELGNTLRELANTIHVTPEKASEYGLLHEYFTKIETQKPKHVDIPKWRHAIISYPHPLLQQGLKILDTPGLNAIGSEAELTLTMLPSAHAAVFILSADTGVTQSDLDIWQNHLKGLDKARRKRLTVVLNKIDTLWDELRSEDEILDTIKSQILYTARMLGVSLKQIFPMSAQKSLLALVRNDKELLTRSGIIELEDHINHEVTQAKQDIIKDDINGEIIEMLINLQDIIKNRITTEQSQLEEMSSIHHQSDNAINQLLAKTQEEQARYRSNSKAFNVCDTSLTDKKQIIQSALDPQIIDNIIQHAQESMQSSWTMGGISKAVREYTEQLACIMDYLDHLVSETRQLTKSIYQRFQQDHGIGVIQPKNYSLEKQITAFNNIVSEAHAFRKGHRIALLGHSKMINQFFATIGIQTQQLFNSIRKDINHWIKNSLQPLSFQIEDHREMLNRQIQDLKLATTSRETIETRLEELSVSIQQQIDQIEQLDSFIKALNTLPNK